MKNIVAHHAPNSRGVARCLIAVVLATGWAPAWAESPATPAPVVIAAVGDVTLGHNFPKYVEEQVKKGKSLAEMHAYAFKEIASVFHDTDLLLVNLECPFTDGGEKVEKNFAFRASPQLAQVLLHSKVGAANLANNHLFDFGQQGITDTIAALQKAGIAAFGAGANLAAARKPAIIERRGMRIGLLGYLFLGPKPIEPELIWAQEEKAGMAGHPNDEKSLAAMVKHDVRALRKKTSHIIVSFHWGRESTHVALPYQRRLARAAVDAGASAVIGHHPHVLQGLEIYKGAPIAYSLGNFIFGGNWNPKPKDGLIIKLRLYEGQKPEIAGVPIYTDGMPDWPFQPRPVDPEAARAILARVKSYSAGYEEIPAFLAGP